MTSHPYDAEPDESWLDWLIPVSRAELNRRLSGIEAHIRAIEETITTLGERMSAVDDIITQLNAATDEIAADLAALRDEVAGSDSAVAAKFQPLLDRLTELGADPENPVPPADGGGDDNGGDVPPLEG